jgi:LacI family transcriptional regulator, galactose operon repressor
MLSTIPRPAAKRRNFSRPQPPRASVGEPADGAPELTQLQEIAAKICGGPNLSPHASRHSGGTVLSVEVLIGIPTGRVATATFPLILKGICDRAELETRDRPEIGSIRIAVRCQAPGEFHPEAEDRSAPREAGGHGLSGTILVYPFAESAVESVLRRNCAVSVLESYSRLGIDVIDTDDEAAISSLVGSLHAAGHTRIGFVSWDYPVGGHWVGRRFNGFDIGIRAMGLRLNRDWVLNVGDGPRLSPEQVADRAARAFAESRVTAWVCAADHQAYPLIQGLQARGIRVPQDCSVTGFDGLEPPAGLPRAASVRVAHDHIGSSALTRMVNRIMYPSSPPRKILVNAQPVPGETIAAPGQP